MKVCFSRPPDSIEYEHGALLETSIMLPARPDPVHMDRLPRHDFPKFPPYDIFPPDTSWANETGVLAPTDGANAESGAELMTIIADRIAETLVKEFGAIRRV